MRNDGPLRLLYQPSRAPLPKLSRAPRGQSRCDTPSRTVLCGQRESQIRNLSYASNSAPAPRPVLPTRHGTARNADRIGKREDLLPPFFKCLLPFRRSDEILYFHLLEFTRAENKIPRCYFIAECLPICAIPNGNFGCRESTTFLKLTNMPATSPGRRYAVVASSYKRDGSREHRVEHFSALKRVRKS